jgi:hypothetical protein
MSSTPGTSLELVVADAFLFVPNTLRAMSHCSGGRAAVAVRCRCRCRCRSRSAAVVVAKAAYDRDTQLPLFLSTLFTYTINTNGLWSRRDWPVRLADLHRIGSYPWTRPVFPDLMLVAVMTLRISHSARLRRRIRKQ